MRKQLFKHWLDFSNSEIKPLFWMLIGPLLVIMTLIITIPTLSNPFLPLITVMGVVLSWRYRVSGFALTLMSFIFYFALNYFLGHREAFFWKIGWGCSLALGLTISYLTMEELRIYYSQQKEKKENIVSDLKISLHAHKEKKAIETRIVQREVEELKEQKESHQKEIEILQSLVEGSRIETEKIFTHSDILSTKSLELHREIASLKEELNGVKEAFDDLQSKHNILINTDKERVEDLNAKRVEIYQTRLLLEGYEKQIKQAREYFITQKKQQPKVDSAENIQKPLLADHKVGQEHQLILQTLEKDKRKRKKIYDQIKFDFDSLKKMVEEKKLIGEKSSKEESVSQMESLNFQLVEKKKKLDVTKSELIEIEREIFIMKKKFQEKGTFIQ